MTEDKPPMVCDECGQPFGDKVVWGFSDPDWNIRFICDDCHRNEPNHEHETNG